METENAADCPLKAPRRYPTTPDNQTASPPSSGRTAGGTEIFTPGKTVKMGRKLSPPVFLCCEVQPVSVKHRFSIPGRGNARTDRRLHADSGPTGFHRRNSCGPAWPRPRRAHWSDHRRVISTSIHCIRDVFPK